jgi:hypothetical protein
MEMKNAVYGKYKHALILAEKTSAATSAVPP